MPQWLTSIFQSIQSLLAQGKIQFTQKAVSEFVNELDLDEGTALQILSSIVIEDFHSRIVSPMTGEWLYIFKPQTHIGILYIKIVVRSHCVIISFHADEEP